MAAAFFSVVPRLLAPHAAGPPTLVAVLFPTIVFGMAALFQFDAYVMGARGRG